MTPEGAVKKDVKKILDSYEAYYYMPVQNGMGRVGIPDFIACVPVEITPDMVGKTIGAFMAIETKAPGKIKGATANQRRELKDISRAGGGAFVTDKADLVDTTIRYLRQTGTTFYFAP